MSKIKSSFHESLCFAVSHSLWMLGWNAFIFWLLLATQYHILPYLLDAPHALMHSHVTVMGVCIGNYLPGAGGDFCKFAQSSKGVASVHVIQRLRAVPQQAEAHGVLTVVLVVLVAPQLILNNPGRGYEAEAADGDQNGGQEHPEAAHTAEHGSSLGQKARRQSQINPKPRFFFFLLPAQERMHLELTPSRAALQLQPQPPHYISKN